MTKNRFLFIFSITLGILFFASFLALSPRNFHDLILYKNAFSDWTRGHSIYERFLTRHDPTGGEFAYPPLFLLTFFPFSLLPAFWLVFLWDFSNLFLLFSSIIIFGKIFLPQEDGFSYLGIFAACLFSYPILFTFQLGQTSLWVLFSIALSIFFFKKGYEKISPVPLIILSFLKFYPVFFSLAFLKSAGKSIKISFLVSCALCFFMTLIFFPKETKLFFFEVLLRRSIPPLFPANQSVDAFFLRTFTGDKGIQPLVHFPAGATFLARLVKLAAACFFLLFFILRTIELEDALVFLILFFLLFSPVVWVHYYVLLIPVCLWFIKNSRLFSTIQKRIIAASFFPLYFSFICFSASWLPFPLKNIFISMPMFCVSVLFAHCLFYLAKNKTGAQP